ncbi:MAG: amino acid permease, partial [Cytophagales bacterium]|nr:amino acid permease [Cytophagales bacterium]
MENDHKISVFTATAMVISNMIGTGIFTSLGFQLMGIHSVSAIATLWIVGGISALCGALCYGELAARFPRSGGEYNFLSRIYDPALGFLSGFISSTIGFAVPIAISAIAFNKYLSTFTHTSFGSWLPVVLVLSIVLVNLRGIKVGGFFQKGITGLTLTLIVSLLVCGTVQGGGSHFNLTWAEADWSAIFSSPFAVSLVYVAYAYTGWNSAAYIAGEIKNPAKNLPIALVAGTSIVTVLYVSLNIVFLYVSPMESLAGQLEIGFITAKNIFGEIGAEIVSGVICIALIGSIFSMTITGPRVSQTVG